MLRWFNKGGADSRVVGIDMHPDGCVLAVVDRSKPDAFQVSAVRHCPFGPDVDPSGPLGEVVRALGVRGSQAVATLQHSAYSLVQLEAPELPVDELREAMRWRVKDLIDFPVEEAVVDVFRLPRSQRPGAPELLYVVVARADAVNRAAEAIQSAGLKVVAVDVVEMSIRNLSLQVDRPGRARSYLHLLPGETLIEIADGPQIYLARRVLQDFDIDADPELLRAQMENLALEVQRSLDYFESQFAFGPADQLSVLAADERLFQSFAEVAGTFLTVSVERFPLDRLACAEGIELPVLSQGASAVGAAMRGAA